MFTIATGNKKSFKQLNHERLRNREYTSSYLNKKRDRLELPNSYPKTRLILIKDFFRSRDLYKAILFFFSAQIIIATIAAGARFPTYAGAMNILAIVMGIIVIIISVKTINGRQRGDATRRRFKLGRVLLTVTAMVVALFVMTNLYRLLGIKMVEQPNQVSLDSLVGLFPVAMFFTVVIISPIVEEIVFRELLPYATGPSYLSFGIASLIFVALHAPFGLMGWTSYGILAIGFTYARLKDNNLYSSIAVHIIWNCLTILVM